MLIDRTHKPWFVGCTLLLTASASAYWALARQSLHGPSGGSVLGLIFGIVGSLMMVFAAMLAVRKRLPTWRIGSAQAWLRGHLWLGTLGFVLILFHAGFGWGGLLENLLWISFGLVVVTGFAGLALQQIIPRLLTTRVPLETMVAQIPFLSQSMLFLADQLVAKQAGTLDLDFESLKPFAKEVLEQQRLLARETDFVKELAKVYSNVASPEPETKKTHTAEPAIVATKPSSPSAPASEVETKSPADAPAAKPKSPLELMREKSAAKAAGGDAPLAPAAEAAKKLSPLEQMKLKAAAAKQAALATTHEPTTSAQAPATAPTTTEKKLSPIEQLRAKKAAAEATAVPPPTDATPTPNAAPVATEKKLSPIDQLRAKKAAAEAAAAPATTSAAAPSADVPAPASEATAAKPLSPLEQMKAKMAAKQAATAPTADAPVKPRSPLEIMQAKLAAAKGSPADKSADSTPPLTVEKPAAGSSPPIKKPPTIAKPSAEKPVAVASPKPKAPMIIPPALLTELRDFHIRVVRPFLDNGRSPQHRLDDGITARRLFTQLRSDLPAELHDAVQELEDLCEERRQFNTQLRLHRWMHWWLILHIPPSIALMVLFIAHVIVSLRVVPFGK